MEIYHTTEASITNPQTYLCKNEERGAAAKLRPSVSQMQAKYLPEKLLLCGPCFAEVFWCVCVVDRPGVIGAVIIQ